MECPALEKKIEEHKAFLRDFQRLMGPEWFELIVVLPLLTDS